MAKQFKVAGVSKGADGYKVRFATDMTRVKILAKYFTDVQLIELPEAMDKPAVVAFLKTSELYANPVYKEVIDNADEKYNPVTTLKVKVVKADKIAKPAKEKAKPSLDAIKNRPLKAIVSPAQDVINATKAVEAAEAAEAAVGEALV